MKKTLIVIAGPTAVGKTALSIQLAKHYQCPVISADSRQFFKEMSIGTAKPSQQEMDGVPHYFIDNKSIFDTYNVGQYEKEAIKKIEELFNEHQYLIVVGGSGLYINALMNGVDDFEEIPLVIREKIISEYQDKGISFLQEELKQLDPAFYNQVDTNNPQRMMRAIEVCWHTGKPFSEQRTQQKKQRSFHIIPLLITMGREKLYQRINDRVEVMLQEGLIKEVEQLYQHKQLNALNTVGYKELFDFIEHKTSLDKAIELIKQNTRRYAKRQLTWFNHQGDFEIFSPTNIDKIKAYISIIEEHIA